MAILRAHLLRTPAVLHVPVQLPKQLGEACVLAAGSKDLQPLLWAVM